LQAKVLIVEDSMVSGYILKKIIEEQNHTVTVSYDGSNLVEQVLNKNIDIVLLDIVMPGADGFDLLNILVNTEETRDIPVIILSSTASALDVKRALDAGAMDFIRKSSEPIEIIARIHSALKFKEKHDQLVLSSQRDHLTQLYNKRFFNTTLDKQIRDVAPHINGIGLLMLDLDHFKNVNDFYGHTFGDYVLASVANGISKSLKFGDHPCRFGGEEFSVILHNVTPFQSYVIAERIRRNIERMDLDFQGKAVKVTLSCGISHIDGQGGKTGAQMVNEADMALYEAKRRGRNQTVLFTEMDNTSVKI